MRRVCVRVKTTVYCRRERRTRGIREAWDRVFPEGHSFHKLLIDKYFHWDMLKTDDVAVLTVCMYVLSGYL